MDGWWPWKIKFVARAHRNRIDLKGTENTVVKLRGDLSCVMDEMKSEIVVIHRKLPIWKTRVISVG